MADFVTLTCPTCGARLEVTKDIERFACSYCGTEQMVRRSGGIVALSPVVEGLKLVQSGVDRTASELAIIRLNHEIHKIELQNSAIIEAVVDRDETSTWSLSGLLAGIVFFMVTVFAFFGIIANSPFSLFIFVVAALLSAGSFAIGIYIGKKESRKRSKQQAETNAKLFENRNKLNHLNAELKIHEENVKCE